MRKAHVKASGSCNAGKEYEGEAMFHQWGVDFHEFETGAGNFSVTIVEDKDGQIWKAYPEDVKFLKTLKQQTMTVRKFVSITDRKGTSIFEVDENNEKMTRSIVRPICDVLPQETEAQTQEVADRIVKALNATL